ncbi:hypothetical protein F4774DRAFT_141632 [Daldinia eschscholtzii]|nr:hypothetical protein F4774DRAFT_141632 [Daldinia eschscholtzii]
MGRYDAYTHIGYIPTHIHTHMWDRARGLVVRSDERENEISLVTFYFTYLPTYLPTYLHTYIFVYLFLREICLVVVMRPWSRGRVMIRMYCVAYAMVPMHTIARYLYRERQREGEMRAALDTYLPKYFRFLPVRKRITCSDLPTFWVGRYLVYRPRYVCLSI